MLAKISVVIDEYIKEYHLDALTLRCWNEMETYLRVCPCVLLSELNDRGIVASCEIDMCSAITMRALSLATEGPAACLDWNNNYGDDLDKVILFHCGSTAQKLMAAKGTDKKAFAIVNDSENEKEVELSVDGAELSCGNVMATDETHVFDEIEPIEKKVILPPFSIRYVEF